MSHGNQFFTFISVNQTDSDWDSSGDEGAASGVQQQDWQPVPSRRGGFRGGFHGKQRGAAGGGPPTVIPGDNPLLPDQTYNKYTNSNNGNFSKKFIPPR